MTFEDQESDGRSVVVATVVTDVESELLIFDRDRSQYVSRGTNLEAGEAIEDLTIELDKPLSESKELAANLYNSDGSNLARDVAQITVVDPPGSIEGIGPTRIDADPDAGFNYPYYLYAPDTYQDRDAKPILAEPNNTGRPTDDFKRHVDAAERAIERGTGKRIADQLSAPFLVPVFPRPRQDPVDSDHYVHQLDDTTMGIEDGKLERVDQQFLNMIADARDRLSERGYPVADGLMLNGFSASGNFVDRFSALHPEKVTSVTAGGLNGMPILPIAEAKGHTLDYHVGIADVEELTDEPFDLEAFRDVNRFLYIGEFDRNDTIPFDDAWTDDSLRQTALDVYGHDPVTDRFPYSKAVYDAIGTSTVFRMYDGAGHTPRPAVGDIVEFHERSLAGDDIDTIRADLGGNVPNLRAHIAVKPTEPTVGEQVAFDASRSSVWNRELVEFEWEFGECETASGPLTTHTFERSGGHNVRLTVTDDAGDTHQAVTQILVHEPESSDGNGDRWHSDDRRDGDCDSYRRNDGKGDPNDREDGKRDSTNREEEKRGSDGHKKGNRCTDDCREGERAPDDRDSREQDGGR